VSRQTVRGTVWQVLTDPYTGRQHRFNDAAWRLLAALDGERTLDAIWQDELARHGDDAATQPEAMRIVAHAFSAQLLLGQLERDARAMVATQRKARRQRRRAAINPLAFRLPLWNPNAALDRWMPWLGGVVHPWVVRLGWLLALAGLAGALWHGDALARDAMAQQGSLRLLLVLWVTWPVMKALHELAHALTIKSLGGEVNEVGVTLMVLTPLPYVDATASSAFADKRERAAVAAAGIWVESVLAAVALAGWLVLQPGLLREICLAVVLVGGVSTLLVNGNPLMRYDGYHVATDLLELPNLAPRSLRWWNLLLQRTLLGARQARMHDLSRGEQPWLVAYAPLSWLWRVALLLTLALTLSHFSQLLGLLLLAMAGWMALGGPVLKALRWIGTSPEAAGRRVPAAAAFTVAGVLGLAGLFMVPVADRTLAPGIVWLPDEAFVRLPGEARVERFLVRDGQPVQAGDALVQLANEDLQADLERALQALRSAQVERLLRFEQDAPRLALADDQLTRLKAEAERLQARADALVVRAAVGGTVVLTDPQRLLGRWLSQGELLAQVLPAGAARVRALVRNEDVARVRNGVDAIAVTLAHRPDTPLPATVERAVPRATRELPSPALGRPAGGPLATDPSDRDGRTAVEPRFAFDLRLPEGEDARVGTRVMVRFDHGHTVAAAVLAREARELFLRHVSE
jgi:putative peptide zinc metalloprotease protein